MSLPELADTLADTAERAMAHGYDSMMNPPIEDLLEHTESKFVLVALAAKRSREITNYLGQLGGGIGAIVPPQVFSESSTKPLSIALSEIAAGKIEAVEIDADGDADADGESGEGASVMDLSLHEQARAPVAPRRPAGGAV